MDARSLALPPVGPIHFLPPTIIHGLLLLLELTEAFSNGHAIRYWALQRLALTGMDLKQSPDAFAHVAPTARFHLTLGTVLEETLHLGTIRTRTFGTAARGGMQQQGHVQLNASLSLGPLCGGQFGLRATANRQRL